MAQPCIIFDHDGRHPLIYMYEPPMQKEELEAGVDELLGTPVEALSLTLGDAQSLLYDSRVGKLWGRDIKKWPHVIWKRAHQNFSHLIKGGHDPLQVLCDRAHGRGLLLYAQLLPQQGPRERMLQSWENPRFKPDDWRDDLRPMEIGNKGGVSADWPGYRAWDYALEEVRALNMDVVAEVLARYPLDGFELQLNYCPYYFHPDEAAAGLEIMTEWIGRIYRAVKRSGKDRELLLRVPADIDGCRAGGLEPLEWMRRGIVDAVVPEAAGMADPSADFGAFVAAAKGTRCRVLPALQSRVDSDRIGEGTIEMVRAGACNFWAQGVDGLYIAHWFGGWPYGADFYEKLREVPYPEVMAAKDKIYRVPTEGAVPAQQAVSPMVDNPLPLELAQGEQARVAFVVSDDVKKWDRAGRVDAVILRIRVTETTERDRLRFVFNGRELPESMLRRVNRMYAMQAPRYRVFGYWFVFRLEKKYWPKRGRNALAVEIVRRDGQVLPAARLRDVELEVKYLMGKNFHRQPVDADLGPSL